jgi:hypothetical protein
MVWQAKKKNTIKKSPHTHSLKTKQKLVFFFSLFFFSIFHDLICFQIVPFACLRQQTKKIKFKWSMEQKGMSTLGGVPNSFLFVFFCPKKINKFRYTAKCRGIEKKKRENPTHIGGQQQQQRWPVCLKRAFFAPFFPKVIQTAFH